jgi:hypothetical protein
MMHTDDDDDDDDDDDACCDQVVNLDNDVLLKYGGFTPFGNKLFKATQVMMMMSRLGSERCVGQAQIYPSCLLLAIMMMEKMMMMMMMMMALTRTSCCCWP